MTEFSLKSINRPGDPENLSDLEKKHLPVLYAPEVVKANEAFSVTVKVGELLKHPNEYGHFIQWIELYAGEAFIGRADLSPVKSEPEVTFKVSLDGSTTLRAIESCNLHGMWENTSEIRVE
jgi:superoxide reductase